MAQYIWNITVNTDLFTNKCPIAILWHCGELISVTILWLNVRRYKRCIGPVGYKQLWSTDHSVLPAVN